MKATAIGPSNIAFIKYWGKKDENLILPENGSISMNLSDLTTTTTVEFLQNLREDSVIIDGKAEKKKIERVSKQLDRVRKIAKFPYKAKVMSQNNFPIGTGLSSSASGLAALSLAASNAAGLNLSEKDLSILARQGSGSACRSIPSGFVEWLDGNSSETSYAKQIFPAKYWNIADVVAVVSEGKKEIPTSVGMLTVQTSPFTPIRLTHMRQKNKLVKKFIKDKKFTQL